MVRYSPVLVLAAVLGATPLSGQSCEGVDPNTGYPLTVQVVDPRGDHTEFTSQLAQALAFRWRVPSRRRDTYRGWDRVKNRLMPPEPRWADDWKPEEKHQAVVELTLFSDGQVSWGDLDVESGDGRFDDSIETMTDEPMPGSQDLPAIPESLKQDSLVVRLHLGVEGVEGYVIRFAAEQTTVKLVRSSLRVEPSSRAARSASATVKYDVSSTGRVDARSIEILRSTNPDLTRAIQDGLRGARFDPATSNCRAISQSVVQTFGN